MKSNEKITARSILSLNKDVFKNAKSNLKQDNFAKLFSFKSTSKINNAEQILSKVDLKTPCTVEESLCPNILTGWLKFLEITDALPDVPNTFIKNKQFYLQQSQDRFTNLVMKDMNGFINIPTEDYFYFELNLKQLKIFTARKPNYRKLDRILELSELITETSFNPCKGGVEDVGNFAEGYCFMLKFTHFSRYFVWELCTDNSFDKDRWMTTLAKINQQNKATFYANPNLSRQITPSAVTVVPPIPALRPLFPTPVFPGPTMGVQSFLPSPVVPMGPMVPQGPTVVSSTIVTRTGNTLTLAAHHGPGWIPVGNWTPCSEPCGPGVQKRQLKCILDDGCNGADREEKMCKLKDCKNDLEGDITRLNKVADCGQWHLLGDWTPCSKQCGGGIQIRKRECLPAGLPCQGAAEITQQCNIQSCSPVEETDCKQIEGQLNLILEMGARPVPVHMIINMNEVTLLREPLLAPLAAIPLSSISNLHLLRTNPGCFSMSNQNQQNYSLCPEHQQESECDMWMRKIQTFKENCNNKMLEKITSDIEKGNCTDPTKQLEQMNKQAMLAEKERTANSLLGLDNKLADFKRQAYAIVDKEDSYEKGLEEQEKIRECKEKKALEDLSKQQQNAAKLLLGELGDLNSGGVPTQDQAIAMKERAVKREMKSIMADVNRKIADKRSKLVSKLQRMKTLHELNQKKLAHKLLEFKKAFGNRIHSLHRTGNPNQCFNLSPTSIENYCDHTFKGPTLDMNFDCKRPKNFCYVCCDHEVGNFDHENLECCYNRCEDMRLKNSLMMPNKCNGFMEVFHVPTVVSVSTTTSCANGRC